MGHHVHGYPVLGPTALTEDAINLDELVFHPWTVQGPRDMSQLVFTVIAEADPASLWLNGSCH